MKYSGRVFLSALLAATLVLVGCAQPTSTNSTTSTQESTTQQAQSADATSTTGSGDSSSATKDTTYFASWEENSPTVKLVKEYVEDVTNESSANFIPVEDRVVTIDFDGTLFGELDPIYFDWAIVVHRVLWDKTYAPTAEQIEVAHTIEEIEKTRTFPEHYDVTHASTLAKVFEGMTQDEIISYAKEFAETDAPKFNNMKRKDSYYVPMRELVTYLEDNDFTCYIVSGTDRTLLRALVPYMYPEIPMSHIIGSPTTYIASGQGDTDGLEYKLTDNDKVVSSGKLEYKDLKMNKVSSIAQEIGAQPVISLGNSSGDGSMAQYATKNNKYKGLALMLCCDDTERDWGELDKAEKMAKSCEESGWHAVSQKNEWKTIYGEGVTINKNWTWTSEIAGPNQAETENTVTQLSAAA